MNAETLLACESFSFGAWVAAHGGNLEAAITALQTLVEEGECMHLQQPELAPEEQEDLGVWDGNYALINGIPFYVGSDGPCGGTPGVVRKRAITHYDQILPL